MADIRFVDKTIIEVTTDGEDFQDEVFEANEILEGITLIEECDNVYTIEFGDGSVGSVCGEAFEIIKEN